MIKNNMIKNNMIKNNMIKNMNRNIMVSTGGGWFQERNFNLIIPNYLLDDKYNKYTLSCIDILVQKEYFVFRNNWVSSGGFNKGENKEIIYCDKNCFCPNLPDKYNFDIGKTALNKMIEFYPPDNEDEIMKHSLAKEKIDELSKEQYQKIFNYIEKNMENKSDCCYACFLHEIVSEKHDEWKLKQYEINGLKIFLPNK